MTLDSAGEPRRVPGSPGERRCKGRPPCHVHVPSSTVVKHKPWRGRAVQLREPGGPVGVSLTDLAGMA
jgi:hypothetical protein